MSSFPRKTLSLPGRTGKVVLTKSDLPSTKGDGYRMEDGGMDTRGLDSRPMNNYPRPPRDRYEDRGNRYGRQQGGYEHRQNSRNQDKGYDNRGYDSKGNEEAPINKIRRGPGRRLAKEKRLRSMDPALLQKYTALSPALQEKVNATIEIYYQQQMAKAYRGQTDEAEAGVEEDHFEADIVYEADSDPES